MSIDVFLLKSLTTWLHWSSKYFSSSGSFSNSFIKMFVVFLLEWRNYDLEIKIQITQSCLVSNQLKRKIYISEVFFRPSSSGKIPRPLQRQQTWIQHFRIVVPYQHPNALTLELEAVALEKVLRNVTSNLRLPSLRYLKNILNQKSQNFSDHLIKKVKTKLEYLLLHLSLASHFWKNKLWN